MFVLQTTATLGYRPEEVKPISKEQSGKNIAFSQPIKREESGANKGGQEIVRLIEGTTTIGPMTIDGVTKTVIRLSAKDQPLFHPIFTDASTKQGYCGVGFDPQAKKMHFWNDPDDPKTANMNNGLGLVAYGDMTVGINEEGAVTHDGMVRGNGKVITLDANNMRIGESANVKPGQINGPADFIYTYVNIDQTPQGGYQFENTVLYRGPGENDFGRFAAPIKFANGESIEKIGLEQMRWKGKDFQPMVRKIPQAVERQMAQTPVLVRPKSPIVSEKIEKKIEPASRTSFAMYEGAQIAYPLNDPEHADVRIRNADHHEMHVYVQRHKEGFNLFPGALHAGAYEYSIQDGAKQGHGRFEITDRA